MTHRRIVQEPRIIFAYSLTPWLRVLPEQPTGLQLVKKFPAFHGTRRFITALTTVRHLCLSWASPIHSTYLHPTFWRSILILSTHLRIGLPSGLFPPGFPTKILYTPSPYPRSPPPSPSHRGSYKAYIFNVLMFTIPTSETMCCLWAVSRTTLYIFTCSQST